MKEKRHSGKAKKIIIAVLSLFIVLSVGITLWLPSFIMKGKRQTLDEAFRWQSERYDTSFYSDLEKEEYTVTGFEDYTLHVCLLKNPEVSDKYVIISHGYTDNRMGALKYAEIYLGLGYNCIIYDLRGHGENSPTITTYGQREGADLAELIKDTRKRYAGLSMLGLHGESLGAATTISSLRYSPNVDFAVADCGFSDIENVLRSTYKNVGLPSFVFDLAEIGAKLRYGVSLKEMRPIDSLNDNEIPVLFIHGENDQLIPPSNSEAMAARTKGYSEYHTVKSAGHAESVFTDRKAYADLIESYLKRI